MSNRTKIDDFRKEYYKKRKCCPNCGSKSGRVTLMAFLMNENDLESYKDLNNFTCINCEKTTKVHNLISEESAKQNFNS